MSMRLSPEDLNVIADKVKALADVNGVDVNQITVFGYDTTKQHHVWLEKDGSKYVIRGISDKPLAHFSMPHRPRMRGANAE